MFLLLSLFSFSGSVMFNDAQSVSSATSRQPPFLVRSQDDKTVINRLEVRIKTRRNRGAGTDNAVYFDIGPIGWKLGKAFHNDFEKGASDTYELKIPAGVKLTTGDIQWSRLHKKGLFGYTGLKDGFDGAWYPESITLVVNDRDYKPLSVTTPLNSRCWYWRSLDPDDADLRSFAQSLRMVRNRPLNVLDKASGLLTTNAFKRRGVSGWLSNPRKRQCTDSGNENLHARELSPMCVTGWVVGKGKSTDGLETIDLKVSEVESCAGGITACSERLPIDKDHGFDQARYIRVENKRTHDLVHKTKAARICGKVLWDTDYEGWWEIHPRDSRDLQALPSQ